MQLVELLVGLFDFLEDSVVELIVIEVAVDFGQIVEPLESSAQSLLGVRERVESGVGAPNIQTHVEHASRNGAIVRHFSEDFKVVDVRLLHVVVTPQRLTSLQLHQILVTLLQNQLLGWTY